MQLRRFAFKEVTIPYRGWELFFMRALFAWLMWAMLPTLVPYTVQPVPNGLGHWVNLTFLSDPLLFQPLRWGFGAALLLFAIGVGPLISLGYAVTLLVLFGTLENSQGAIGHHLQLVCLAGGAQWLAYAKNMGRHPGTVIRPSAEVHCQAVHWAKIIIVASYITSACVKLIASGGRWIAQLPDISLQLIKTHANVYYDTLVPQTGWMSEQLPHFIALHPELTRVFFSPGLLLELLAFLALGGRRPALIVGLGLLTMHLLVRWVMNLSFSAHEWLLVIYFLNIPYLLWLLGRQVKSCLFRPEAENLAAR
jgi:hypothetical protein